MKKSVHGFDEIAADEHRETLRTVLVAILEAIGSGVRNTNNVQKFYILAQNADADVVICYDIVATFQRPVALQTMANVNLAVTKKLSSAPSFVGFCTNMDVSSVLPGQAERTVSGLLVCINISGTVGKSFIPPEVRLELEQPARKRSRPF